jgi:hypothetical protein
VRIFKTRWFTRFARKEGIRDERLAQAVAEVERGLMEADLGRGLIKKRVAREGRGKSGGYRTIIAYRKGKRSIFVYGFSKSSADNIDDAELEELRNLARLYLEFSEHDMQDAINTGTFKEIDVYD